MSHPKGTITASSGITLPFEKVVGRPADPNDAYEHDFQLTPDQLVLIATRTWVEQGFLGVGDLRQIHGWGYVINSRHRQAASSLDTYMVWSISPMSTYQPLYDWSSMCG